MRSETLCLAVLSVVIGLTLPAHAADDTSPASRADKLFVEGKFPEAAESYAKIVADRPGDYDATLRLARIALLADRLDEAEAWSKAASALNPEEDDPKVLLSAAYYRRDDFPKAADALKGVDADTNALLITQYPTLNVAKLESFAGQTPYEVEGEGPSTRVTLLATDPLPLLRVRVNGGDEVTFFIDTGASEIILDSAFAKELGLPSFGSIKGTFSGGQTSDLQQSRIESLAIGDWTVRNLPAATLPLRDLSEGLGVKRIDGIVGTTFFYHFLTTLDVPGRELVLRRKTAEALDDFVKAAGSAVAVPIWMAGDHFMVGWGKIESLPPSLLFVDTGLAGAGAKLAQSVIDAAGITLDKDKAVPGAGAGGTLVTIPYVVSTLSFGDARQDNVEGLYDGPFPWENLFGFHLAGMVGHDFFQNYAMTFDFDNMRIFLQ